LGDQPDQGTAVIWIFTGLLLMGAGVAVLVIALLLWISLFSGDEL